MAEKDYAETLFQAVEVLINKKIESIKFDETINATITDASKSAQGQYVVSTGNAKFVAYSPETSYRENEAVMVTIPQGNYDNQKIIVGKAVDNNNTPMVYKSPFQELVNVSNNLISGKKELGFWANNTTATEGAYWAEDIDFTRSAVYDTIVENNQHINGCWWDSGEIFEQGFTRLGLQAQFSTWLQEYETAYGNYGLAVELTFKNLENDTTFQKIITFDSDEFFGNVYDFETFYTQENVYDISDFINYPIVRIKLFPYQRGNFKKANGELIYALEENNFSTIGANIFIKDPYLCLGRSAEDFNGDSVELLASPSLTYRKSFLDEETFEERAAANEKIVGVRWIHKNENGIISPVQDGEIPPGYSVRWYRYKIGQPSPDEVSGAHWQRFLGSLSGENALTEGSETSDWSITETADDMATNHLEIIFQPDVNNQTEQLKVAIVTVDSNDNVLSFVASSQILVFSNDDEIRNEATIVEADALSIRYEDDEKGHYFLYNEAGEIGANEDGEIRVLTAYFENAPLVGSECATIKWTFPNANDNTMIVPMSSTGVDATLLPADGQGNHIIVSDGEFKPVQVGFTIKKHLNHSATQNTITLEIQKDGSKYLAQVQPIFGTAGTNGSNYTLVMTWLDNKNAVNLSNGFDHTLVGEIDIFDQAGNVIPWPEDATLTYNWYVAEYGQDTRREKEVETADIYYPVFDGTYHKPLFDSENANSPDYGYQSGEFYYFTVDTTSQDFDITDYYTFNPTTDSFEQAESVNQILYKKADNNTRKNKLEFKQVSFFESPLNQESGEITDKGNLSPIEVYLDTEDNKYKKKYFYSSKRRYFIKYNNSYILDPWITYSETETYYEPIEAKEIEYIVGPNELAAGALDCSISRNIVTLTAQQNTSMNSIFVLELTLSNFGDYDLVSYYPIPLKNGETLDGLQQTFIVDYIEGPDRVRYSADGEADYNKNPYKITCRSFENDDFETYRQGYEDNVNNLNGYWKLLFPYNYEETNFEPQLIESVEVLGLQDDEYNIPYLNPSSVYISEAVPYAIQFFDENDEVLWTQPILVYENNYPSATLNKWNGKDIEIDKESGTITASGFAAGKKERDNSFTGVVIGDWSRTAAETSITKNTGIYGFNHGAMSYAFKDDGTGFIGKDTRGRIYFEGDKSQIYSSNWRGNKELGLLLDIDDGYLKLQAKDDNASVYTRQTDSVKTRFFTWTDGTYLLRSGTYYKNINGTWTQITSSTTLEIGDQISASNDGSNPITLSDNPDGNDYILIYCKENTKDTLNPFYEHRLFKDQYGNNEVGLNETYSGSYAYYLKEGNMRYITLGANQPRTPLSIGTEKDVQARRFRVDWDGTMHVIDGDFRGNITGSNISGGTIDGGYITGGTIRGANIYANYLEADVGKIAEWTLAYHQDLGHYLINKYDSTYKALVILSSLQGIRTNKFTMLYENGTNNYSILGTIGELEGEIPSDNPYYDSSSVTTCFGIRSGTSSSSNNHSIVLESPYYVQGASDLGYRNIRLSGRYGYNSAGIYLYGYKVIIGQKNLAWQNVPILRGAGITNEIIFRSENITFDNIPAANQTGIYARFA